MRLVVPADSVTYSEWRPRLFALGLVAAVLGGIVGGGLLTLAWPRGFLGKYEYHVWQWEARTAVRSPFAVIGLVRTPDEAARARALNEYFRLTTAIRETEDQSDPDLALIAALTADRRLYENDVERSIETWVEEAATRSGLQRRLPLFRGLRITWPPVDLELTRPPRLLVRSPRAEIRRAGDTLLRDDITLEEVEAIEEHVDNEDTVSIVVAVGGIAVYPAIVRDDRSFDSLLSTAAHEWVHHYLAFFPLGGIWGDGGDAETLNETTADLAGDELARLVRAAHPVGLAAGTDGSRPERERPRIDLNAEMRSLRLEVDRLLASGDIRGAERLMAEKRAFLEANGIFLRKLNQAYFAFYGTYAESPASSNPIGPMVRRVWELTGNVGAFLAVMRDVTSRGELERAIAELEGK